MKEEFLHFIWKYGLYDKDRLTDESGNQIIVLNPGDYNRDAGPDFFNARISAGGTVWAGNVEIHTLSSHFYSHGHNTDPSYDNVILHLVWKNDKRVYNSRGQDLLTVELSFEDALHEKYLSLLRDPYIIACHGEIRDYDKVLLHNWIDALAIERLEGKAENVKTVLLQTGNDWEETFYIYLARYFGFRVNTGPFGMLATSLPFRILRRHSDNRFQMEALLYGTAGMLEKAMFHEAVEDQYYKDLVKEYRILSSKYSLQPLHGWIWKFARLRPSNFPTLRLSQLAALLMTAGGLFSRVLETEDHGQLKSLFLVSASSYWDDHYLFGTLKKGRAKNTGDQFADIMIINTVVPVLFLYGKQRGINELCDRALKFLELTDAEDNSIVREWGQIGISSFSALESQALLQLRESYCKIRRCLECRIGYRLISSGIELKDRSRLILEP